MEFNRINMDDCEELCRRAGILDEFHLKGDNIEDVVHKAADILGLHIFDEIPDNEDRTELAESLVAEGRYDEIVEMMDDDIRERLHFKLAPCTDEEFLKAYLDAYFKRYGHNMIL